jgi:hypothetical protein
VGDALGMLLHDLRKTINRRLAVKAGGMADATAEVVDTTLRFWPERTMARYASRGEAEGPKVLQAIAVIWAKVREDLEARWGTSANTMAALDLLVQPVVIELAHIWFNSIEERIDFRRCIWEARHLRRA